MWTDLIEFESLLVSSNGEVVDFVVPVDYREPAAYASLSYEQVKQLNEVIGRLDSGLSNAQRYVRPL